jgi:hypothetical protein
MLSEISCFYALSKFNLLKLLRNFCNQGASQMDHRE